jgi:pimeloyl-ACP methyl ester carboxylesterase
MTNLYAEAFRLKLSAGNEVEAFVRIAGGEVTRPKCLLLHGNPGSLLEFAPMIPRLARGADLAAIDLPGFGRSACTPPNPEALSLERLAEHAILALNALGWHEPVFLVGHSHGGGVAQIVAARFADRIAGLVLVNTLGAIAHANYRLFSLPGATAAARVLGRLLRAGALRRVNRAILRRVLVELYSPEKVPTETLDYELELLTSRPEILSSMVHVALGQPCAELLRSASEIRCPTLFVHGSNDAVVPAKNARAIHERIAESGGTSQFHVLQGAGHMLLHQQAPELVDLITEHLHAAAGPVSGERRAASALRDRAFG